MLQNFRRYFGYWRRRYLDLRYDCYFRCSIPGETWQVSGVDRSGCNAGKLARSYNRGYLLGESVMAMVFCMSL